MILTLKLKIYILLSFLLYSSYCQDVQQVPIINKSYGFSIGDSSGPLRIQFFLDFLCPDSLLAYNQLMKVMRVSNLYEKGVQLTYQFSPLSWHFYSFKITEAFFYILDKENSQKAEMFIAYIFANQQIFQEQQWIDKNVQDFIDFLSQSIATMTHLNKGDIKKGLLVNSKYHEIAKNHWKYTVSNKIEGAPYFKINNIKLDAFQFYKSRDWLNLIKQYNGNGKINYHQA